MWLLLFVVLVPVTGIDKVTKLEQYTSREKCESERERIMVEMNKEYPGDDTYTLVCSLATTGV